MIILNKGTVHPIKILYNNMISASQASNEVSNITYDTLLSNMDKLKLPKKGKN